jgi:hypothetical protein
VVCGESEVISWPWEHDGPPDLSSVDELARLALAVRRLGWSVRVQDPSNALRELLDLVGLRLVVEVGGEAEEGEEVGVEKRVEPGDPVP